MSEIKINGIMPALTTPFDDDGKVEFEKLIDNVSRYNQTGLAGYVALGSNGEAVHLTPEERASVIRTVKKAAAPGRLLVAGVNEHSTRAAIECARQAADCGADAVLVITPYYYKNSMSQEAILRHMTEVADSSPVPLLIYNVPQNTGVTIEPATVASIAGHPNIAGIKDSAGNISAISDTVRLSEPGFSVLVGSGSVLYPALLVGAVGAVLAVACVAPSACVDLYEAARAGDLAKARTLHNRIAPLSHVVTAVFGVPGLKAALDMGGFHGGPPRPPLLALDEANREKVRSVMRGSGFFASLE
jgi:4-hydroxy-2-oxoglutarate aldolase